MQQAKSGDNVKVHYHGKLVDGTTFDSSAGREPLAFKLGSGMVIPGFDNAITGMIVGEKKTINIPFMEAYGPVEEERIMEFPKEQFPKDMEAEVGMQLQMSDNAGHVLPVTIKEIKEDVIVLDANHPLAGQDLCFDIELVEIEGGSGLIIMP